MHKNILFFLCVILLVGCASLNKKKMKEAKIYYEGGTAALVEGDYASALSRLLNAVKLDPRDA